MENDKKLLICKCNSIEHQLIIEYNKDDNEVYVNTFLNNGTLWERIKNSIKYIFGYKSQYGHFDEFIMDEKYAPYLRKLANTLEHKNDNN